jgi:hypothetical protein
MKKFITLALIIELTAVGILSFTSFYVSAKDVPCLDICQTISPNYLRIIISILVISLTIFFLLTQYKYKAKNIKK